MDERAGQVVDRLERAQAGDEIVFAGGEGALVGKPVGGVQRAGIGNGLRQPPGAIADDERPGRFVPDEAETLDDFVHHVVEDVRGFACIGPAARRAAVCG